MRRLADPALLPEAPANVWLGDDLNPVAARRHDAVPTLQLDGFDGPLDFLLAMARSKRVDLSGMSFPDLVDQVAAAIAFAAGRVPLPRQADWLVMVGWLLDLRSQLLLPAATRTSARNDPHADPSVDMVVERARVRALAAWLEQRLQLGRDVFGRGASERPRQPLAATQFFVDFLEATLATLEARLGQPEEATAADYQPVPLAFWRLSEAVELVLQRLSDEPGRRPLERFLPAPQPGQSWSAIRVRAAIASTFLAGLELARSGQLVIEQEQAFGPVLFGA